MGDTMEASQGASGRRTFWSGTMAASFMLVLFALVPLVPLVMTINRAEILSWRAASALNQFESGQRKEGLALLQTLAAMQPENFQIQQRLVECLIETREYDQAKATAARIHSIVSKQVKESQIHPVNLRPVSSLYARSLVASGRPSRALAILQQTRDLLNESGTLKELDFRYVLDMSNEIAYHAALAGEQLNMATALMQEVFAARQSKMQFAQSYNVSTDHQVVISAMLVSFKLGNQDRIAGLLDREIVLVEEAAAEIRKSMLANYHLWMSDGVTGQPGSEPATLATLRNVLGSVHFEMALLLAVRSLALEGNPREDLKLLAVRDRFRVADLGYDASSLLRLLPDIRQCLVEAQEGAMLLDTSGLVLLKQRKLQLALRSFDLACQANEIVTVAMDGPVGEHPQEMHDWTMAKKLRDKMTAILHLHRGQCHQALGNDNLAKMDFAQVSKLGFDKDDPDLF